MDKDFLLDSETAKILYHNYAEGLPVIDYHCHLQPKEIYQDKKFRNLAEVWLGAGDRYGDHYKWRALRARGYAEDSISGPDDDYKKFYQFAESMPYFVGNPLYHWSHLEMKRYFGIDEIINAKNAKVIWEKANSVLQTLSAREMMKKMQVEVVCTTDDPIDDLIWHKKIKEDSAFNIKVLPTFRPDKAVNIQNEGFAEYISQLASVANTPIVCLNDLTLALSRRIDYFADMGAKVSDHSLEVVRFKNASYEEADKALKKALAGNALSVEEESVYKGYLLLFFGKEYAKRNWVMQLHIGATRNNSKLMYSKVGADTGFDGMGDSSFINNLSALLSSLEEIEALPKTILYCLNNKDNYALTVLAGCFQKQGVKGRVQVGTAWWFLDQQDGMRQNMEVLMQVGVISNSVGMLTDSRSFLAYPRHEYYRRILCSKLGYLVESGQYPEEELQTLGKIVQNICYNNAKEFFNF